MIFPIIFQRDHLVRALWIIVQHLWLAWIICEVVNALDLGEDVAYHYEEAIIVVKKPAISINYPRMQH